MSSRGKIRRKRHLRQLLRRYGACLACGPLLGRTAPEGHPAVVAKLSCPKCGRLLRLDISSDSPEQKETLRRYACMIALHQGFPPGPFTIKLDDGREVLNDTICGCAPDSPCKHPRLLLEFDSQGQAARYADYF